MRHRKNNTDSVHQCLHCIYSHNKGVSSAHMKYCTESSQMFFGNNMQKYIAEQTMRKDKKWIYDVIKNKREQDTILYRDFDNRFVILPSTEANGYIKGYLVIFTDPKLTCLRNLKGQHIPLLLEVLEVCQYVIPVEFCHASFHYHPTVYQLHLHFKRYAKIELKNPRVYPLTYVILVLAIDPNFFQTASMNVRLYDTCPLAKLLKESKYNPDTSDNAT